MAKVTDQSFDHDYDGIKEYDNPLPRWWVWMFVLCVVWAVVYVPYYHFGPGMLPREVYDEDMAAWLAAHPPEPLPDEAAMIEMAADESLVATGASVFASRCVTCHGPDGGGQVGPNLTDDYTLHGYSRAAIVKVVNDGVPAKGMLAWKNQLSRQEIYGVALYVYGLRGTTPANPKPPQGDPIVDEPVPAEGGAAAEGTPAEGTPTEGAAEGTAEGAPAEGAPAEGAPAEGAPAEGAPVEGAAPTDEAVPAEGAPTGDAVVDGSAPTDQAAPTDPPADDAAPAADAAPEAGESP